MNDRERAELATFGEHFVYMPDHGTKSTPGMRTSSTRSRPASCRPLPLPLPLPLRRRARPLPRRPPRAARDRPLPPRPLCDHRPLKESDALAIAANVGIFAIERTEAEHFRAHTFAMLADFDLADVLHGEFGPHLPDEDGPHEILVEFAADKAGYVTSRTWHDSQRVEVMRDGAVRVPMRLPALAPRRSWVLEWGAAARALAPSRLVNEVADEAQRTVGHYR